MPLFCWVYAINPYGVLCFVFLSHQKSVCFPYWGFALKIFVKIPSFDKDNWNFIFLLKRGINIRPYYFSRTANHRFFFWKTSTKICGIFSYRRKILNISAERFLFSRKSKTFLRGIFCSVESLKHFWGAFSYHRKTSNIFEGSFLFSRKSQTFLRGVFNSLESLLQICETFSIH